MLKPILTLWGLYKYDTTLFDRLVVPVGINKDNVIEFIFMYANTNEVRYSDPEVMKRLIGSWSESRTSEWSRMHTAMSSSYSPIENYDRTEEKTISTTELRNRNGTIKDVGVDNVSGTETRNKDDTVTMSGEEKVSAFDSAEYQPSKQNTDNNAIKSVYSAESAGKSNRTLDRTENSNEDNKGTHTETLHAHGNIGVTTNQQMIEAEIELRKKNLYKIIALEFEEEFTIPVYERSCNSYVL